MSVLSVEKDYADLSITLIAEFDASQERVWQLFADPRQLERWWGPPGYPATTAFVTQVIGGGPLFRPTRSAPLECLRQRKPVPVAPIGQSARRRSICYRRLAIRSVGNEQHAAGPVGLRDEVTQSGACRQRLGDIADDGKAKPVVLHLLEERTGHAGPQFEEVGVKPRSRMRWPLTSRSIVVRHKSCSLPGEGLRCRDAGKGRTGWRVILCILRPGAVQIRETGSRLALRRSLDRGSGPRTARHRSPGRGPLR